MENNNTEKWQLDEVRNYVEQLIKKRRIPTEKLVKFGRGMKEASDNHAKNKDSISTSKTNDKNEIDRED